MKRIVTTTFLSLVFGISFSQTIPSYVPTTGLIAWYPFTNNVKDSSGNGNHGTVVNTLPFVADRFGSPNSAITTDNGYVTCPSSIFQYSRSDSFSISAWFTTTALVGNGRLVSTEAPEGNFRISTYGNGAVAVQYGSDYIFDTVSMNSWIHIVFTYNNRNQRLYVNGVLKYSGLDATTESLHYSSATPFTIGAKASASFDSWQGKIDDIAIYNRALSSSEALQLYTPPTTGVASLYQNESMVQIFPNPASDYVVVRFTEIGSEKNDIAIFNSLGQQVYRIDKNSSNDVMHIISTTDFTPGVYMIRIMNGSNSLTRKLIVE